MKIDEVNMLSYICLTISAFSMITTIALSLVWKICRAMGFVRRFEGRHNKKKENQTQVSEEKTEKTEETVLLK